MIQRILGCLFLVLVITALAQCARRGTPSGGDKDILPPELIKAVPENLSTNFSAKKIRLYFNEYIKLKDVQEQLIISPPLKYAPLIKPQGSASKYIEIIIKDTLKENTTYTFNFGQSIIDNNEGNPNSFLNYVFSTGDYIDSLEVTGAVLDAFNKSSDKFISVMLYEIDSTYNDSTVYLRPPNYITNTLDSTNIFRLKNLKAGEYSLFAIKDEGKNNLFDQNSDKIGFTANTITIPTDSIYALSLFKEVLDYNISVPKFAAKNKIIFGYQGIPDNVVIETLTQFPDTISTLVTKEPKKDTLNYWFTPFEMDSIIFVIKNEYEKKIDTFTVKSRKKVPTDSLKTTPNQSGNLSFIDSFHIRVNTPVTSIDTSKINITNKDSLAVNFKAMLDSTENRLNFDFERLPNEQYIIELFPGAIQDFFNTENDTITLKFSTKSFADLGNLTLNIDGDVSYPLIVQLTNDKGEVQREIYIKEAKPIVFNYIDPTNYRIRVIFDANKNGKWDTGNYLKKIQPERVSHYPELIEVRANWELEQTFTIVN